MCFYNQDPGDTLRFSLARDGAGFRLGEHFTLIEAASKDGADEVLAHPSLIVLVNQIRRHFGRVTTVNSWYRTPAHNRRVGGASQSQHVLGMAADIVVRGVSPARVAAYAESLGAGGVGRYKTFTHVDVVGVGRRWSG